VLSWIIFKYIYMFYGHEWHIYNTVRIQDGMMVQTLTWQHLKTCVSAVVAPRPRCVPLQDNIWISTASAAAVGFDPLRRLGVVTSVGLWDVHRISWGHGHLTNHMGVSWNEGTQQWMVYNGKSYWNGWFRDTTILGNFHIWLVFVTGFMFNTWNGMIQSD
jgi:hypothetical protein